MKTKLEICVDSPEDLSSAVEAGVDRIELCSALDLGGLSPTSELIDQAINSTVPVYVMVRPRAGNFVYSELEIQAMEAEMDTLRDAGFPGVVFGATTPDHQLDHNVLKRLVKAAEGMQMTLHRAVDILESPRSAVQIAIDLGFERILTSGGAPKAVQGVDEIGKMIEISGESIEIMAGSGVDADCVKTLFAAGVRSFHASCRRKQSNGQKELSVVALHELQGALASE